MSLRRCWSLLWVCWLPTCAGESGTDEAPAASDMGQAGDRGCPNDLPSRADCAVQMPSYRLQVAPVIERRCGTCHDEGGQASAVVFDDYERLYARRQTVLTRIYSCVMPPAGAPELMPEERATLLEWFTCDAPDN